VPLSLNREAPSTALIYFPGASPPPDGAFGRLANRGISIEAMEGGG
jgi:hypothetical protein